MPKPVVFPTLTKELRDRVHRSIRYLAEQCDGAREIDHAGFSKDDTDLGRYFARRDHLSDDDLQSAAEMVVKYHRQLDESEVRAAWTVLDLLN